MRPFKIGDRVKIGAIIGDVTVTNSTVLQNNTTNFSTNTLSPNTGLIIHTTIIIGYDVP